MKIRHLLFIPSIGISIIYGQTPSKVLRTETIDYKQGKTTFQCYEDPKNFNLIKHGTFNFSENQKGDYGSQVATITGQFKDGYRDGLWSYTIKKIDAENQDGTYTTGTLTSTQNFKIGFPDGQWTLNNTWKTRSRTVVDFKYVWGPYSNSESESASFSFKNGIMVGAVNFNENGKSKTINLNQDGFVTGSFVENNSGTTTEKNFNSKGVITKYVERASASGNVLNSINFDADLLQIADDYLANRKSLADLKGVLVKVDTVKGVAENAGLMFFTDYFYLPGIDGDKTITNKGNERVHGRYIKFERIKIVPFEQHPNWRRGYDANSKIVNYQDFLKNYGNEISKVDYEKVEQLINSAKSELKSRDAEKEYAALVKKIDDLLVVKTIASKTEGNKPYNVATHVFARNSGLMIEKQGKYAEKMFFSFKYGKLDFTVLGHVKFEKNYTKSLRMLQEYINFLNNRQLAMDSIVSIDVWTKDIAFYINDIECKYVINQDNSSFNTYSDSKPKQTQKPILYNAYFSVLNNLLNQLSESKTFKDYYECFFQLNELSSFVNKSLGNDTSKIEESLSKANDFKTQLSIFLQSSI